MLDVVDLARRQLAGSFIRLFPAPADDRPTVAWVDKASADPGLFGPGSAAWRVHGDLATLVGGLRALLLQTLHPLTMAGVAEHSNYRHDPFGRLQRTGAFLAATVYGTTRDAERAITAVSRIHRHVHGTAPDGRPYTATDPHLLTFVHVTEVDSFLASNQRYGSIRLSGVDADRYVAEMAQVGRRLGGHDVPVDRTGLRRWLDDVRTDLRYSSQAMDAVRFLMFPPLPLAARPAYAVVASAAVGLLPLWAQRMLWLPSFPPVDLLAIRPATRAMLGALGWALGSSPEADAARHRTATGRAAAP